MSVRGRLILIGLLLGGGLSAGIVLGQGVPSHFVSDDFSTGELNGDVWTFVDPVGDGAYSLTGAGSENAWLNLIVPAGTDHDVWSGGNRSVRMMQAIPDTNLDVEVKFETSLDDSYQLQGIIVEQDAGNFLRFDFYTDGTRTYVFGVAFKDGVPVQATQNSVDLGGTFIEPLYMRLSRRGDLWRQSYSLDGETWMPAAEFTLPIAIHAIGPFAGNSGRNPAFVASVDYFVNRLIPIPEEDPNIPALAALFPTATIKPSMTPTPTITPTPTVTPTPPATATQTLTPTATPFPLPVTLEPGQVAFVSDDFSSLVLNNNLWTLVDPVGDGQISLNGQGTSDAYAVISLPANSEHDVWLGKNTVVRLMQPARNVDFSLEIKFSSGVSERYQLQGVFVWQDEGNFLRLEFYSDTDNTHLLATSFIDSIPTQPLLLDVPVVENGFAPLWMRVERHGHTWTQSYSLNGIIWTPGVEFEHPMIVTEVGFYAGNPGSGRFPAFSSRVDYFFNLDAPIVPEDPVAP